MTVRHGHVIGGERLRHHVVAVEADSAAPFRLTVPSGRLFLLSDNASTATDSRTHVGAGSETTDGTVAADAIIGTVVTRIWPLDRLGAPDSPSTTQP